MVIYDSMDISIPKGSTCVALGLFDGLHRGHVPVITAAVEKAREEGRKSCVFTFTAKNAFPRSKTPGMLQTKDTFLRHLDDLGVDITIMPDFADFSDMSPEDFREVLTGRFGASFISVGENFRFGKDARGDTTMLSSLREARIRVIPTVKHDGVAVSSSLIRSYINDGNVINANMLLGRRFSIDFEVVHGRALGRTIGSPTINQPFPDGFVIPRFGVYATISATGGSRYPSVTNVGVKPTVGSERLLAETYIHGFSGDLYGESVTVEFLEFIRPERRFSNMDELKAQIMLDSGKAAEIAGNSYSK